MDKLEEIIEILIEHEHCNPNNCSVAGEIRNGHVLDMLRIHHSEYEKLKGDYGRIVQEAQERTPTWIYERVVEGNTKLKKENERLREALKEILKGKGSYSLDTLEHCANTVEDMKELAKQALESEREGE